MVWPTVWTPQHQGWVDATLFACAFRRIPWPVAVPLVSLNWLKDLTAVCATVVMISRYFLEGDNSIWHI